MPSLFFAGNVLPDLLTVSGDTRIREVSGATGSLANGVRLHLAADKAFHSGVDFKTLQEEATALLKDAPFQEVVRRRFFVAHVLVELALDAAVLRHEPDIADDFYKQLSAALADGLIPKTETLLTQPVPNLLPTIERFIAHPFLYDYLTPEGCATALARVSRRVGLGNFTNDEEKTIAAQIFVQFAPVIEARFDDLFTNSVPVIQ